MPGGLTNSPDRSKTGGKIHRDGELGRCVVRVRRSEAARARPRGTLHVASLSVGRTVRPPEVDARRRCSEHARLVLYILVSIGGARARPNRCPVVIVINAGMSEHHVDRWVVLDVQADGKVDILRRRGEIFLGSRIGSDNRKHVRRTDACRDVLAKLHNIIEPGAYQTGREASLYRKHRQTV